MSINIGGTFSGNQKAVFDQISNSSNKTLTVGNPLNSTHPADCSNFSTVAVGSDVLNTCIDKNQMKWVEHENKWF